MTRKIKTLRGLVIALGILMAVAGLHAAFATPTAGSYGCAIPITDTGAQLIADTNVCLQNGNGELNVLYYNAKGDGVTSSTVGISNAVAALLANNGNGGTVVLPTGKFVIDGNGLNMTNEIGVILKGQSYGEPNSGIEHGTELYCETSTSIPCVDLTGSSDSGLEKLNVRSINGGGTVAVMMARSSTHQFSQLNFLRDVYVYWNSSPTANGGLGSAGIYNWGSELDTLDNIHIFGADVGIYHANKNDFGFVSQYASICTTTPSNNCATVQGSDGSVSATGITIVGKSTISAEQGPPIYEGGTQEAALDFGSIYLNHDIGYTSEIAHPHSPFAFIFPQVSRVEWHGELENITQAAEFTRGISSGIHLSGYVPYQVASIPIAGISNATPAVVTTSAAHGLITSGYAHIASVGGCTAANGDWIATWLSATTFSIPVTCNSSYTSGGSVQGVPMGTDAQCPVLEGINEPCGTEVALAYNASFPVGVQNSTFDFDNKGVHYPTPVIAELPNGSGTTNSSGAQSSHLYVPTSAIVDLPAGAGAGDWLWNDDNVSSDPLDVSIAGGAAGLLNGLFRMFGSGDGFTGSFYQVSGVQVIGANVVNPVPTTVGAITCNSSNVGWYTVTDSTAVATEGQTCAGSNSNKAAAFCNGTTLKCF